MLNIDENQLKLLLEQKRKVLERKKYDGTGEIISGISLIITLTLSDFNQLKIINPLYLKIIVGGISIAVLLYGIYTFIRSIKIYSLDQLYSEIKDIDPKMEHSFDIIVIRDIHKNGRYLVFKSKRWNCWLFPNYHCLNENFSKEKELKYVKECIRRDLKISKEIEIKYIGNKISEKYSVGDKVRKKYNFHYFQIVDISFDFSNKRTFWCNGKKYCWKTLDQMYSDKNIIKKNEDVLDYVRGKCDIS